jgi:hypothetical protein
MARAACSYPDEWTPLLEARTQSEGRSESSYLTRLIQLDLQACGLLTGTEKTQAKELVSRIEAAMAPLDTAGREKLLSDILGVISKGRRETRRKAA